MMRGPSHTSFAIFLAAIFSVGWLVAPTASVAQRTGGGSGQSLILDPAQIHFGTVIVGGTKTVTCTLRNPGPGKVTLSAAVSSSPVFRVTRLSFPAVLAPGQTVNFAIQFAPKHLKTVTATSTFTSSPKTLGASLLVDGMGVQAGTLASAPAVYFGPVSVGESKRLNLILTNQGFSAVMISRESLIGPRFSLSGLRLPLTLAPAESITFSLTFTPRHGGRVGGGLLLTSDATNPSVSIPIFGHGLSNISLSWTPSTSSVAGYYVYRSTISGGPYSRLTLTPNLSTSYRDTAMVAGQTYYYVVTSVNSKGVESGYSDQAVAVVPSS
jgi:hypothetical protein